MISEGNRICSLLTGEEENALLEAETMTHECCKCVGAIKGDEGYCKRVVKCPKSGKDIQCCGVRLDSKEGHLLLYATS